jgi:hypothetical protein
MTQTIQSSLIQIDELESRFNLQEVVDDQFFKEWQDDLPAISDWEKESLDRLKAGYLNLLKKPTLLENSVRMAVLHPLLFISGFYLSPFHVKPETHPFYTLIPRFIVYYFFISFPSFSLLGRTVCIL